MDKSTKILLFSILSVIFIVTQFSVSILSLLSCIGGDYILNGAGITNLTLVPVPQLNINQQVISSLGSAILVILVELSSVWLNLVSWATFLIFAFLILKEEILEIVNYVMTTKIVFLKKR